MNIDRLLARFSIQTKVIVLVMPLILGMAGRASINLYTGSLLVPIFIHAIFNAVNLAALLLSGVTYTP